MSKNTQDWIKDLLADVDRTIRIPSDVPADNPDLLYNRIIRIKPALVQVSDHAPKPVLDLVPTVNREELGIFAVLLAKHFVPGVLRSGIKR